MKRLSGVDGTTTVSDAVDKVAMLHHTMKDGKWKILRGDFKRLIGIKMLSEDRLKEFESELLEIHNLMIVNMDSYFVVCEPAFLNSVREVSSDTIREYMKVQETTPVVRQLPDAAVVITINTKASPDFKHNKLTEALTMLCKMRARIEVTVDDKTRHVIASAVSADSDNITLELVV
jgi:hypothetical protein